MTSGDDRPGTAADERAEQLRALFEGEPASEQELAQLRAVAELGGTLDRHDLSPTPPPSALFDDVRRRARAAHDPVDADVAAMVPDGANTVDPPGEPAEPQPASAGHAVSVAPAAGRTERRRPPRRRLLPALAAAAAVALVAVVVLPDDDDLLDDRASSLTALVDDVSGRAAVDGEVVLLDAELPALADGAFYEVWLLDAEVETLVSLGALRSGGILELPDDADLSRTPLLDVSVEQPDGDPSHSGRSVLRGELET